MYIAARMAANDASEVPGIEHVTVRRATPADYNDVMAIDPHVFDGLDYLPDSYLNYLKDPNRFLFLILVGKTVVGFHQFFLVNGDDTLHGMSARLSPLFRNRGILKKAHHHCLNLLKRKIPTVKYVSATFINIAPIKRFPWVIRMAKHRLDLLITKSVLNVHERMPASTGDRISCGTTRFMSVDDTTAALQHHDTKWRLFPHNYIVINWEAFRLGQVGNMEKIKKQITSSSTSVVGTSSSREIPLESISFCTTASIPLGTRCDLDYYGDSEENLTQHFHYHLDTIINKIEKGNFYFIVLFSQKLSRQKIVALLCQLPHVSERMGPRTAYMATSPLQDFLDSRL